MSTRPFPLVAGSGTCYPFSEEANMEPATSAPPEGSDAVPAASTLGGESLTEPEISGGNVVLSAVDSEHATVAEELENGVEKTEDGVIDSKYHCYVHCAVIDARL